MQFPTTSGAHSHWPSKIVISRVISWNLKISHRWGWKPSVHISSKIRGNLEKYYKNTAFQEKVLRGSFQWVSVSIVCDHSNTRFPTFLLRILSNQTGKMVEHGFFVQNTVRKLLEVACYRRKSPGSLLLWEWCSWLCMIWSSFSLNLSVDPVDKSNGVGQRSRQDFKNCWENFRSISSVAKV